MTDKVMKTFFCHIPKNSGTSICGYYHNNFKASGIYGVPIANRAKFYTHAINIINQYDFISGHIPLSEIEEHIASFDVIFCVVRNPLCRFISMCDYVTTHDPLYAEFENNYKGFLAEYYFKNSATRNEQCSYIGFYNRFRSVLDRLADNKNIVVLRHEHLDADFNAFCKKFDLPDQPLEVLNKTDSKPEKLAIYGQLANDEEFYKSIFNWFDDDFLLHDYLCQVGPIFP